MEWHPYTLSSSPHEDYLEVHIKGLGDHTNKLVAKAQSGATLRPYLRVDGPFGRPSLNYRRYETLILVAGGIGITPAISMLKAIYDINIGKKGKVRSETRGPFLLFFLVGKTLDRSVLLHATIQQQCALTSSSLLFPSPPLLFIV